MNTLLQGSHNFLIWQNMSLLWCQVHFKLYVSSGVHLSISRSKWNVFFLSSYLRNESLHICQVAGGQGSQNTIVSTSPPPLQQLQSWPCITSPTVMEASSNVSVMSACYVNYVKQWLPVEEEKILETSSGILWHVLECWNTLMNSY
jgi:hypothetical protein